MADYLVPARRFSAESWVKNSRFIATIGPAFSISEAKAFIVQINQQYPDSSHNVPVYLIGFGSTVTSHSSDAGEPSGTAGRPALSVLTGSGLGDTVLVITRYFGGTKLGTGGLVKAYGNAAKIAVQGVPKAKKISVHQVSLICPYNIYESSLRLIKAHKGIAIKEAFTEYVKIDFSLPVKEMNALQSAITELTKGQIALTIHKKNLVALQPINGTEDSTSHA